VSEEAAGPLVTNVDVADGWEKDEETGGSVRMLREEGTLMIGLWKPDAVAGRRVEYVLTADETLLVLNGSGEARVDHGEPIQLRPGVVMSMSRGSHYSWVVDDEFCELWIYS
jgi:uncharacterized cupin superfamily protein